MQKCNQTTNHKDNNNFSNLIIAVDGVSASGKGSLARSIAVKYNLAYLETGALYRAVGYLVQEKQVDLQDEAAIAKLTESVGVLNLEELPLYTEKVAHLASVVAKLPLVRQGLLGLQKQFALSTHTNKNGVILDGRDISTKICPFADLKFFIVADLKERATRRYNQIKDKNHVTLEGILQALNIRDDLDEPLNCLAKNLPDIIIIDNTKLTLLETVNLAEEHINSYLNNNKKKLVSLQKN